MAANHLNILPTTIITSAVTGVTTEMRTLPADVVALTMTANFVRGGGGSTADFWIQSSTDNVKWIDIASFNPTTASIVKVFSVNALLAHTHATATDGTLGDNTILNGWIGSYLRVKYTTTGTYSSNSSINITGVAKSLTSR
jgi:hypothetical protein